MADFDGERVAAIKIEPGGLLAAISDGVLEARSAAGEILDPPRVIATLDRVRSGSPQEILDALRQQLIDWQGKEEPVDDQTIVLVEEIAQELNRGRGYVDDFCCRLHRFDLLLQLAHLFRRYQAIA